MMIVGHRGAKGLALENTAASIEAALTYGVDMVEIDLRLSHDGVVVLLHDSNPIARGGERVDMTKLTFQQLLRYFPDMLTLEQAMNLTKMRCVLMLEFKDNESIEPAIKILKRAFRRGWQAKDFMFASFDFDRLTTLHRLLPEVPTVVLDRWSSIRAVRHARRIGTSYISMDQRYLWPVVIQQLSRHYKLFCYPNHRLIHIKHAKPGKWVKYGLYGVITDYPNLFLDKTKPKV